MSEANTNLLDAALWLADVGYRVFPCVPGGKAPLTSHGCLDATDDLDQVERWWTDHPTANIGIATQGLLVVDVDGPDNAWLADEPQKQLDLAVAPCSLTANGGRQHLFRQPAARDWRNTTGKLAPHVDTRANGGYIVAPPSMLTGGLSYRWQPGAELEIGPGELPEPPAWLIDQLDMLATGTPTSARVGEGEAEANPIPAGLRNATLASLAGTMRRVGMSAPEIAAALHRVNGNRCAPPLPEAEVEGIARSIARYEPDSVATAVVENHYAQDCPAAGVWVEPAIDDPGPFPQHLLEVPGFVGDVAQHTLRTAPYPQPILAFAGALALQAFLAGRKVRDSSDARTNLYVLALANSGAGKDHPRKLNQRILFEAGLQECLGDKFASGEGIEDRLFTHPSMLFQTDEIDGLMQSINRAGDARHESILNVLLKMYTSGNSIYPMRVKAGKEAPGIIDQPSLSMLGTAVPKYYYEALSMRMLNNGFFARLLILEADKRGQGQDPVFSDLPERVIEIARWWAAFKPGAEGNLTNWHPRPRLVEHTAAARDVLSDLRCRADQRYVEAEQRDDPAAMAIWARAYEKARKLALIYAVSASHETPLMDKHAAEWASELVEYQTRRMLFMADQHVAEGEFDAKCKRMVEVLTSHRQRKGDEWMPHWYLSRLLKWSDREIDEVRDTLLGQERIEFGTGSTNRGGRSANRYRLPA